MASLSTFAAIFLATLLVASASAVNCRGKALYDLIFTCKAQAGRGDFIDGLAVSPLSAVAHDGSWTLWTSLGYASPGLALLARSGQSALLRGEIIEAATANLARRDFARTRRAVAANATFAVTLKVDPRRPYISSAAMLAPSGDWFFGIHRFNTCNTTSGEYFSSASLDLGLYDAGTSKTKGFTFEESMHEVPQRNIRRIVSEFPVPNNEAVCSVNIERVDLAVPDNLAEDKLPTPNFFGFDIDLDAIASRT